MTYLRVTLLTFSFLLSSCAQLDKSQNNSTQNWRKNCRQKVCLLIQQDPENLSETFQVKSELAFPITLTLRVEFAQASTIPNVNKGEITKVIHPFGKSDLLVLNPDNPKESLIFDFLYWWNIGKPNQVHDDATIYRLPFVPGTKVSALKQSKGPKYSVDWPVEQGTQIFAARSGIVIDIKMDSSIGGPNEAFVDDANFVMLLHSDGSRAKYIHLQKNSAQVQIGDMVQEGQLLAYTGNTGFLTKPKFQFVVDKIIDGRISESLPIRFKSKEKKDFSPSPGEFVTTID